MSDGLSAEEAAPVEVTTRYVTTCETLADAWAFVMARLDSVGPDPSVEVSPVWSVSVQDMERPDAPQPPRHFEVVVSGMVREAS